MAAHRTKDESRKNLETEKTEKTERKAHLLRACLVADPQERKAEKTFQVLVRTSVKRHGGLLVRKTEKDFLALFDSASGALQAGLRIDSEVRRINRRSVSPLDVQIAVQTDNRLTAEEWRIKPDPPAPDPKPAFGVVLPESKKEPAPANPFVTALESAGASESVAPSEDLRKFTLDVFNAGQEKLMELHDRVDRVIPLKEILLGSLVLTMVASSLLIPLQRPSMSWLAHLPFSFGRIASAPPSPVSIAAVPAPAGPAVAPRISAVRLRSLRQARPPVPVPVAAPAVPPALSILGASDFGRWEVLNADGSTARKSSDGKALRLDYDFGTGDWIQLKRDIAFEPEGSVLKGAWKSEGAKNRLRIELVDEDGSTFVDGWTLEPKDGWTRIEFPLDGFKYQGGGNATLDRVVQVYFSLEKREGGAGAVLLDDWTVGPAQK